MTLSDFQKNDYINRNRQEYENNYSLLRFISPYECEEFEEKRNELLLKLKATENVSFACNDTKPYYGELSTGCKSCGAGTWSCLFISGQCNANCIYCPTAQDEQGIPMTNTVSFPFPEEYAAYALAMKFNGISISGGEPLLDFRKTMNYIQAVQKNNNSYLWLYTNGILAERELLHQLKDAGINEIRFNIGATGYDISAVRKAVGIIDNVTVEIPLLPGINKNYKVILEELNDAGVKFVNLHQLRLTPYNILKLYDRDYTFLHGPKVVVLESELEIMQLLLFAAENKLAVSVNYCSFIYKHIFQRLGARQRHAKFLVKSGEILTPNGYIRSYHERIDKILVYYEPVLSPIQPVDNDYTEIQLTSSRKIFMERRKVFEKKVCDPDEYKTDAEMQFYEKVPQGLLEYF